MREILLSDVRGKVRSPLYAAAQPKYDPIRVLVWSVFFAAIPAAWIAIGVVFWKYML